MWIRAAVTVLLVSGLCACGASDGPVRGLNEFESAGKPDLALPPDFGLVPPRAGEARPRRLSPEAQARIAIFGEDIGTTASTGERGFVAAAGADKVPESIRALVNYEFGSRVYKSGALTNDILASAGIPVDITALDAAAEDERLSSIKSVTGGKPVYIRRQKIRDKLPGL